MSGCPASRWTARETRRTLQSQTHVVLASALHSSPEAHASSALHSHLLLRCACRVGPAGALLQTGHDSRFTSLQRRTPGLRCFVESAPKRLSLTDQRIRHTIFTTRYHRLRQRYSHLDFARHDSRSCTLKRRSLAEVRATSSAAPRTKLLPRLPQRSPERSSCASAKTPVGLVAALRPQGGRNPRESPAPDAGVIPCLLRRPRFARPRWACDT